MSKKSIFVLLLSLILVLGTATAASASHGKGNAKWKPVQQNKKAVQLVDIGSHWAEQPIRAVGSWGIILGYPDFTFRPNQSVSKYEAIMMIARASGFNDEYDSGDSDWDDSDAPAWMKKCLDYAVANEILTETEAENFKGWQPAKRYEVAVWAMRAIGLDLDNQVPFGDLQEIPAYAKPYVGGMFKYRYMVGYPGNKFQPNKPVTRAELASILYRILMEKPAGDDDDSDDDSDSVIKLAKLSPADGEDDVNGEDTTVLEARFNLDIAVVAGKTLLDAVTVYNKDDDEEVEIKKVEIEGDTLVITLESSLEQGDTFEVTLKANYLEDEDGEDIFDGIDGEDWSFTTEA